MSRTKGAGIDKEAVGKAAPGRKVAGKAPAAAGSEAEAKARRSEGGKPKDSPEPIGDNQQEHRAADDAAKSAANAEVPGNGAARSIRPGISDRFLIAAGVAVLDDPNYSLCIPYHDLDGHLTGHCRWRLRKTRADGQKYYQKPDSGSHLYFSHVVLGAAETLHVTEGEFKALALLEAGYPTIGLPGLHCYTHADGEAPVLLPGLAEAVTRTGCQRVCFIGDADTLTNLEYYRSAGVLAQSLSQVAVHLIQVPLGGPKGIDDLRESMNSEFASWLEKARESAIRVDTEKSFLSAAVVALEACGANIHGLIPQEREHHMERLVRMAALARCSAESQFAIERLCTTAQRQSKLTVPAFGASVAYALATQRGEEAREEVNAKIAYYNAIQPWPADRPLEDILQEGVEITRRYIVADPRYMLITACWAAYTHTYQTSPYLPMVVYTGAEEDCGKSTYMRVVGRMSYRSFVLIATATLHRVLQTYSGTFLLDESKQLSENRDMISFINAGFDNSSRHPVDSPLLTRYDTESGANVEFDPKFPKALAGIGTFLERDTLSRSIVVNMERYTRSEQQQVLEYNDTIDQYTLPIYRAFLRFFTPERQAEFAPHCQQMLPLFPKDLISRRRQKFVPLITIADLAGPRLRDEVLDAVVWMSNRKDDDNATFGHRLLVDIARLYFRQVALHQMGRLRDPLPPNAPLDIGYQPDTHRYLFPTPALVEQLIKLPEAPWACYGRNKQLLDQNALCEMMKPYGLRTEQLKIERKGVRGLRFDLFRTPYERNRRPGDPTFDSVKEELVKDISDFSPASTAAPAPEPAPAPPAPAPPAPAPPAPAPPAPTPAMREAMTTADAPLIPPSSPQSSFQAT